MKILSGIRKGILAGAAAALLASVPITAFAEQITLRVPSWWFGEPGNKVWMEKVVQAFMDENPDIKVEGYNVAYGAYADQMLLEMGSGSPPDVIHLLNMNIGDFLRNDLLLPLDGYVAKSDISKETYSPAQFESPLMVDGHTYGVIQMVANYVPFYNETILKAAGYDKFPDNPKDFLELAKKTTKAPNQFGYAAMVKPGSYIQTYMDVAQWVIANGGHFAIDGKPTVDDPRNIEAISMFKELFDAGVMPRDVDKSTYRQMWWQGKVGTLFDGSWMMGFAKAGNPEIVKDLRTAPMPWPGHRTAAAFQLWAIPKDAPHPDEAFKLIEFMQSAKWQKEMVAITNAVSPRLNSIPDGYLEANPWFATFQEASDKYAVSIMPAGLELYGNEVLKIIADKVEEILYKNRPVAEAMAEAQAQVVALVKN